MKVYGLIFLTTIALISCSKQNEIKPTSNIAVTKGKAATDTGKTAKPDSTLGLNHDDSVHLAAFNVKPQSVTSKVTDKTLTLYFDENINILLSAEGYQKTSAVHLKEDFKNTFLNGFDFTTVAEAGNTTLNWVDDNLNNVALKTITDTTVSQQKMIKINVHRTFTFFKTFTSATEAQNQNDMLANRLNDKVGFSTYSYYNQKNYPVTTTTAGVVYFK